MPIISMSDAWCLIAITLGLLWARSLEKQNAELHEELLEERRKSSGESLTETSHPGDA